MEMIQKIPKVKTLPKKVKDKPIKAGKDIDPLSPLGYVNSITYTKDNVMRNSGNTELAEKSYIPYVVNKALSNFVDCILYANDMNMYPNLPKKMQYEYLLNSIRRDRRFSKWAKKSDNADLNIVMEYFSYNSNKARETLKILTQEQLGEIKSELEYNKKIMQQ